MRFRQIHLDFHTSPAIEGIGKAFDKAQWQAALKTGHVDSVTAFSKCHHGWSYHETSVGKRHPHLDFDLLTEQFNAAKEIDVNVPIYLSAGVDNLASYEHPEWREVGPDGRYTGWARDVTQAGFHKICFHSPYLDYLCLQIEEAVRLYPTCDGVFLDIVSHGQCCCRWCLEVMHREGLDATVEVDRIACSQLALQRYYERTTAACKVDDADMPVFHNSGHIPRGKRD
ncbi:MAG: beta-galactosidase, partial [Phycisphaerae bacterium]|nr:beta-galactosidase [Phycisphaerae bacterium]